MTTDYSTMMDPAMTEAMAGFMTIYYIVALALGIVSIIGMWKMFAKSKLFKLICKCWQISLNILY